MTKDNQIDLYNDNEKNLNRLVSKIVIWTTLAIPLLIIGRVTNIFPNLNYFDLFIILGYMVLSSFIFKLLCYLKPYSSSLKYIILVLIDILIFMISINKGFSPFISYLFLPLISCLYFNKFFSIHISILSYITMIVSIIIRAIKIATYQDNSAFGWEWGLGYGIGLSIEFSLNIIVLIIVSNQNYSLINENVQIISKIQNLQTTLTSSYTALIAEKDKTMKEHLNNTTVFLKILCKKLRTNRLFSDILEESYINDLISASPLHDIGLISINESILNKKEPLTQEEFCIYKTHTVEGERIINENMSSIENRNFFKISKEIALYHHEKWDGSGYPTGRKNIDIPLSARIIAIADSLDNLLSNKPYREGYSLDRTFDIISTLSGTDFDPQIVSALFQAKKEINAYLLEQKKS